MQSTLKEILSTLQRGLNVKIVHEKTDMKLKPCPFCGYSRNFIKSVITFDEGEKYRGECPECNAHSSLCEDRLLAKEAWNSRF